MLNAFVGDGSWPKRNKAACRFRNATKGEQGVTTRKWVGTEDDAWSMVALAVKLCGEQGAYRGPAGATSVYIAFGEIVLSKE